MPREKPRTPEWVIAADIWSNTPEAEELRSNEELLAPRRSRPEPKDEAEAPSKPYRPYRKRIDRHTNAELAASRAIAECLGRLDAAGLRRPSMGDALRYAKVLLGLSWTPSRSCWFRALKLLESGDAVGTGTPGGHGEPGGEQPGEHGDGVLLTGGERLRDGSLSSVSDFESGQQLVDAHEPEVAVAQFVHQDLPLLEESQLVPEASSNADAGP